MVGLGRARAATWLARADCAGLLYGAIVSASALATASVHGQDATFVGAATGMALGVYWLAHVYIHALSGSLAGEGAERRFLRRLRASSAHETGVVEGGLPAIIVYAVADLAGVDTATAAAVAVYFSVVLLAAVGHLGAHQAGMQGRIVLLEVAGAAFFGVLIVAAKTLLH